MRLDIEPLKIGLFQLNTRRFGRLAELMMLRLEKLTDSGLQLHDLRSGDGTRIECKFSRVTRAHEAPIALDNWQPALLSAGLSRQVAFLGELPRFQCAINQVKRELFDRLYYGCFFADAVVIFRLDSRDIDSRVHFSESQHRGSRGEGIFSITRETLPLHLAQHFHHALTYPQLFSVLDGGPTPSLDPALAQRIAELADTRIASRAAPAQPGLW